MTDMNHDLLCPPGIKAFPPEDCVYCHIALRAREEERKNMANVPIAELLLSAYARGREDAAVAVREFPVHSIPFLPSDTPLSMAVRVKEIVSIAAVGTPSKDDDDK